MLSPLAFESIAFLLGLLFGSFLNVCISRLPAHRSLSRPRSHCPHCQATIRWFDNIPVISWILLRARCRSCQNPISWRYPAVEIAVGLWFAYVSRVAYFLYDRFQPHPYLVYPVPPNYDLAFRAIALLLLGFLLIGLLVMDWQTHTLPDAFTLTGIVLAFVLICARALFLGPHEDEVLLHGQNPLSSPGNVVDRGNVILTGPEHLVLGRLLAIVLAASLLLLVRFAYKKIRHRDGLGLGDAKLLALIAAFLGFWPAILTLFLGVVLCSTYALTLMARGRATAATRLPLGTFLCIGGLIVALLGPQLITWYTSLL
jgi:leader peptidase (prepilin peptidase)/N-methyltransferase